MNTELKLPIYSNDEFSNISNAHDDKDPVVRVNILPLTQRIRNMRTLCRDHDLSQVSIWCYAPEWKELLMDDCIIHPDVAELTVTNEEFFFTCYVKHTTIQLTTQFKKVSELKAMGI